MKATRKGITILLYIIIFSGACHNPAPPENISSTQKIDIRIDSFFFAITPDTVLIDYPRFNDSDLQSEILKFIFKGAFTQEGKLCKEFIYSNLYLSEGEISFLSTGTSDNLYIAVQIKNVPLVYTTEVTEKHFIVKRFLDKNLIEINPKIKDSIY